MWFSHKLGHWLCKWYQEPIFSLFFLLCWPLGYLLCRILLRSNLLSWKVTHISSAVVSSQNTVMSSRALPVALQIPPSRLLGAPLWRKSQLAFMSSRISWLYWLSRHLYRPAEQVRITFSFLGKFVKTHQLGRVHEEGRFRSFPQSFCLWRMIRLLIFSRPSFRAFDSQFYFTSIRTSVIWISLSSLLVSHPEQCSRQKKSAFISQLL